MTKLKTLEIANFRHIQNQTVEFGKYLTVITGLNGTGKSSILGWIAQLCDYKAKDITILDTLFKEMYLNFVQAMIMTKNMKLDFITSLKIH